MTESTVDDSWKEYWATNGTFTFESDASRQARELDREADIQRGLARIREGQNRLLRVVAKAVDEVFPPDEFGDGHGTGHVAPGDIVRGFIVDPDKGLSGDSGS